MSQPAIHRFDHMAPVRATREMLHEMAATFAEEQFALKGHAPFMWLLGCGTHITWIETDWEDDDEKERSVAMIRKLAYRTRADCYAFISEAWVSVYKGPVLPRDHPRPSEMPKHLRDDIMFVLSVDRDEHKTSRWLVTERRNGPNFLGPRVEMEDMPASGQMLSILKGWR